MNNITSPGDAMHQAQHILITDSSAEKPSNLAFLLKLAGFQISEFDDELEACNWLLQNDPTFKPAVLLLLNEPKPDRSLFALLFQMRQRFNSLEILLVAPEDIPLQGQLVNLDPPVHQCPAGEVHHLVKQIFRPAPLANPDLGRFDAPL